MSEKDPLIHFPFYINQYQGLLSKYSFLEKGAFLSLLCVFLADDGVLPKKNEQLYRMCVAFSDEEKAALNYVKEEVIRIGKEILINQKLKRGKCREAARLGGLKKVANAKANAKETLKRFPSNTETETETYKEERERERGEDKKTKAKKATDEMLKAEIEKKLIQSNNHQIKNLPPEIDPKDWIDFVEHRQELNKQNKKNAKLTIKAAENIIAELVKYENNQIGSARQAIKISIMNGWKGVFEPRAAFKPTKIDETNEVINDFINEK